MIKKRWTGCTNLSECSAISRKLSIISSITCKLGRFVWTVVHFVKRYCTTNMFENLFNGVQKKIKACIRIRFCDVLWPINCRNDVVFNKSINANFLQVMHKVAYWINLWSFLLPVNPGVFMATRCTRLIPDVRTIFNEGGCDMYSVRFSLRTQCSSLISGQIALTSEHVC